ncbi:two-component regulator propeller domain-containing protein, partial [Candidatus Venteria ishoeyi]|uniref:two-component regulator propeller domain-containing protein n=1 Tax=Candidatus Venteria ishoeyi TaxID=1899563 RepID=UPI0011AFD4BB
MLSAIIHALKIGVILQARAGIAGIWVGTGKGLIHRTESGKWTDFTSQNSNLPYDYISSTQTNLTWRSIESDGKGGIWFITKDINSPYPYKSQLVHRSVDDIWSIFTKDNSGLVSNYPNVLLTDQNGGVWIGTNSEYENETLISASVVYRSKDGNWTVFNSDNSLLPKYLYGIVELVNNPSGGLWIGTRGNGIYYKSAQNEWQELNMDNSDLLHNYIAGIEVDVQGDLWIAFEDLANASSGAGGGLAHLSFSQPRLANLSGKRAVLLIHPEPIRGHNTHTIGEKISGSIYNSLLNRYYRNDEIYFLAYKPDIDINQDYHADKNAVDAPVTFLQKSQGATPRAITKADIRQAFSWAQNQGVLNQPLLVVIVGHGMNDGNILLNPATNETLSGAELGVMLNDYQQATQNQAIVILESAYSGA